MKLFGIVSYNKYANFTNYGSALQSWALNTIVNKLGEKYGWKAMFVDYCPDILADKDPLNPFKNSWDQDEESKRRIELSMPAIRVNYIKFMDFYDKRFNHTKKSYTSKNFNNIVINEHIDGFICGSDTIFCYKEFGFDDGYFANFECMRGHSVAYAPSFGDTNMDEIDKNRLSTLLNNFKYIGLREAEHLEFVKSCVNVPVKKVIDPTLLLDKDDYDTLVSKRFINDDYLLLYSRRNNPVMTNYADEIAKEKGLKVVDISLNVENHYKHIMCYDAGVEEFLSLVKDAKYVITNSFHGMIMAVLFRKEFEIFSREQCDNKIEEVLQLFGLPERMVTQGNVTLSKIDFDIVHAKIREARKEALTVLKEELCNLIER